jgi:UDP-N-acetyl-2-amino-2-deoxyglucuronate dehydrogenase
MRGMAVPHPSGTPSVRALHAWTGSGPLGLGLVGCGRFATFHARAARRLGGAVRIAFASRDPARAEAYRRRFGGFAAFGSYEAAAADPRVDALVVCTPHHLHETHARLAAEHGKAILLEKPIARTLAEADAILSAADSAGVVLMVAENAHFVPGFVAARAYLRDRAIGEVRQVVVAARGYRRPSGWRGRRAEMGGGLLIDGGIHYLHLLRDWVGPVDEVVAFSPPNTFPEIEGEDTVFLLLRFRSGAVATLVNSIAAPALRRSQWAWLTGTEGSLGVDHRGRALWLRGRRGTRARVFVRDRRGLVAQLTEFVAAVRERRPPSLPPESARADLALVLAAYRSLETGRPAAPEPSG